MPRTAKIAPQQENTLGGELRNVRLLQGRTLKQVEQDTGINNAYLSQLETGKIERPSAEKLAKLADYYGLPHEKVMAWANRDPQAKPPPRTLTGAALSTLQDLTPQEEAELAKYLAFLRSRRGQP